MLIGQMTFIGMLRPKHKGGTKEIMKRFRKKIFMYIILILLIAWPLTQMVEMLTANRASAKPEVLLYQVSLFQMELLNSYLLDSGKFKNTDSLNALRQAVYSAQFAHDHLVQAFGEAKLAKLESLGEILQYLLRLQIGGERPLKSDEIQTMVEVGKQFNEMYEAYGKLLSTTGGVVDSQNARLSKSDQSVTELLKKKLLQ